MVERKLDISVKFESDRKSGVLGKDDDVGKDGIDEDVGRVDDDELIVVFDEFVVDVFIGAYSVKSRSNVFSSMI